ncbi:MAG TPA: hypothetical protein VE282_05120, partial [Gemmatimonadales bacterium]|nr:hypothetical protein [Gemmatimonadales bacterium]
IRFTGRVPGKDVKIVFTGLRPGEKLTEEQISLLEASVPTSTEKIRISQTTESAGPELVQKLSRLLAYLELGDREGLLATLCELVPECVPPLQRFQAELPRIALSTGIAIDPRVSIIDPTDASLRERRRVPLRLPDPPELRLIDRREGVPCRRKTPRVGGRRRTDVGALLAAGTSSSH